MIKKGWLPLLVVLLFLFSFWDFSATPIVHTSRILLLRPGASVKILAQDLHQRFGYRWATYFEYYVRFRGDAAKLHAGQYQLKAGITGPELLALLFSGHVMVHQLTLVPGWTFAEVRRALLAAPFLQTTIRGLSNVMLMRQLGDPAQHPEGLFFPNTYQYIWGESDLLILHEAKLLMQRQLQSAWRQRAAGLPYHTPYDALIVASMIEKETALPHERYLIAGVIERRLEKHMHLDIDATVRFGLGLKPGQKLTSADLRVNTPYNTYRHYGLPPTPICLPSLASIRAALHPAKERSLYYVANGHGGHVFADTLAQQRRNIAKYLR